MGFKCGIIGLPNVGKSTLFNALTETAAAAAENYAFCTIEPNVGQVPVPDPRLDKIAELAKSARIVPTQLAFVDIAGLVRGASKGEGLGNKFLSHIREVDAVLHVLRCFENADVVHVEGAIDPVADAETVETELMLADLESLERRVATGIKQARGGDKEAKAQLALMERVLDLLRDGKPARAANFEGDDAARLKGLQLLTSKKVLYVCNVDEESVATGNKFSRAVAEKAAREGAGAVTISAAIEAEIAQMEDPADRKEFLDGIGLEETGLARVIRTGYELLDLITFFTAGPKEARAWTVRRGALAPQAAGVIHSDFERGFIRAETTSYEDYTALGGEQGAKAAGKMRLEGKEYVVQDGDIMLFRFNA
ncbi:MAG TPA: redox-regulated ATPase YchF [Alphaproteobacteria bacterium]|nr:redox-regulated ATPase YchF [Alphaproteobacteria bacterium]